MIIGRWMDPRNLPLLCSHLKERNKHVLAYLFPPNKKEEDKKKIFDNEDFMTRRKISFAMVQMRIGIRTLEHFTLYVV